MSWPCDWWICRANGWRLIPQCKKSRKQLELSDSSTACRWRSWLGLSDKKPMMCVQAGELADDCKLARRQNQEPQDKFDNPPQKESPGTSKKWSSYCWVAGHLKSDCHKLLAKREKEAPGQEPGRRLLLCCFSCRKEGHTAASCPSKPVLLCQSPTTVDARPPKIDVWHRTGTIEGQYINEILLDTACKRTMLHQELVPSKKL